MINLWQDEHRLTDFIGENKDCPHLFVREERCTKCGAFSGFIGKEKDPTLFYKHIDLLSNSFIETEDVYIISDRYFPPDYKLKAFGMAIDKYKNFKFRDCYTIISTPSPYMHQKVTKYKYLIHFTNEKHSLWSNKILYSKGLDYLSIIVSNDTLLVNPSKKELSYYSSYFTFFITNTSIMVLLQDLGKQREINLLRYDL